jgi:hypothetical protein
MNKTAITGIKNVNESIKKTACKLILSIINVLKAGPMAMARIYTIAKREKAFVISLAGTISDIVDDLAGKNN